MCWCSGDPGQDCSSEDAFSVEFGLLTINGVYITAEACIIGDQCESSSIGVGLADGDRMMLKSNACGSLEDAVHLQGGGVSSPARQRGTIFEFGTFNFSTLSAVYQKCWCQIRGQIACTRATDFQAEGGTLTLLCPAGYFDRGGVCENCTEGYFCLGRETTRQQCPAAETTIGMGASTRDECLCMPGYERDVPRLSSVGLIVQEFLWHATIALKGFSVAGKFQVHGPRCNARCEVVHS